MKDVIVIGVIGDDCHSVGNRIMESVFSEAGFKVVNLGVMVKQDEFINAAAESGARAVLVSSLYGHAAIDCCGFRERCIERGLGSILLYAGGNLVVGKTSFQIVEEKFKALGFDRVFSASVPLSEAVELLRADIEELRNEDEYEEFSGGAGTGAVRVADRS